MMPANISIEAIMEWIVGPLFRIALIVAVAWVLTRLLKPALARLEPLMVRAKPKDETEPEAQKRAHTLTQIIWQVTRISIAVVALIMLLGQLGLQIGPILAGIGIMGLAVGFGAQSLVKDFITGFFLLMENHYRVGDVIEVAGTGGLVEAITLRVTKLRDLEGRVHIIPNGQIDTLTNFTKDYSRAVLNIGVAYKEDVDEVMDVLKEIAEEMRQDPAFGELILEPMEMLGVEEFADSQVTIRLRFKTQPIKQWVVAREFRRRVKKTFDAKGIEIPFPHRTIYMGVPEHQGRLYVEKLVAVKEGGGS